MNKLRMQVLLIALVFSVLCVPVYALQTPSSSNLYVKKCLILYHDLRLGMRDASVLELQFFLKDGGYFTLEPTGYFGEFTLAAVKKYQATKGIVPVFGFVGPITRGVIGGETCSGETVEASSTTPAIQNEITKALPSAANTINGAVIEQMKNSESRIVSVEGSEADSPVRAGDIASIKGTNLFSPGITPEVYVGNKKAEVASFDNENVYFVMPDIEPGSYDVYLVTDGKSNPVTVTVDPIDMTPAIEVVVGSEANGLNIVSDDSAVAIGEYFVCKGVVSDLYVDNLKAIINEYNNNILYFKMPKLNLGSHQVHVESSCGKSEPVEIEVIK